MLRDRHVSYDDFTTKIEQNMSGKRILLSDVSGCGTWLCAIPTRLK